MMMHPHGPYGGQHHPQTQQHATMGKSFDFNKYRKEQVPGGKPQAVNMIGHQITGFSP